MNSNKFGIIEKRERLSVEALPLENPECTNKMEVAPTTSNLTRYMLLIHEFRRLTSHPQSLKMGPVELVLYPPLFKMSP